MKPKHLISIIIAVLVLSSLVYIASVKKAEAPVSYTSQADCEKKTGKVCSFFMCDYVLPGKTFEETCGKYSKGWQPVGEPVGLQPIPSISPQPSVESSIPTSYRSEKECEAKTGKWCWQEVTNSSSLWKSSDQAIPPKITFSGVVPEDWRRYTNGPKKISFAIPRSWESKLDFENSTDVRVSFASSTNSHFPDPSSSMLFSMSQGNFISLENYRKINDTCESFPKELRPNCINNIVSIGTTEEQKTLVMQRPRVCSSWQSGNASGLTSAVACSENYVGVARIGGKYLFLWTQNGITNFASSTELLLDIAESLNME